MYQGFSIATFDFQRVEPANMGRYEETGRVHLQACGVQQWWVSTTRMASYQ
jgi:hypothetical protein